ncbi:MAG TPA: excinuclease ABC subunit UvrC [Firmicutes bacterium]|uniref:UvrABC system protein C n=1 Tax=Capillibacterium thermochitinicola TaxID=2699427 RepID=A0A8J6I3U3_9FIRM|nr:excinuclease ABC subunit UvrC [Capillibacterium thermochitinicola]MBA2133732.1 excinuclease ABC subunit UvrC [Capillibacterium thermochitinicola]HHW12870.1 excinuclease ABC subunit UvrC [Bacillota bacterium]
MNEEELRTIPTTPGVYLMKNEADQILYVGKANSLRHRVRSYFQPAKKHPPRIARMVEQVAKVDFITTASEIEALALECNLIKEHRPKYNVRLRDDKQYPWLKVTWQEPYPRVYIVRRPQRDGARYFGPFTEAGALREILRLLQKIFPLRSCKRSLKPEERLRPCLNYHIGRCLAPCAGEVDPETYRQMVQEFCRVLEGHTEQLEAKLKEEMEAAAARQEYEEAAVYRDKLRALQKVVQRQTVVSTAPIDRDVFGLALTDEGSFIQVLQIRRGKLIGKEGFFFTDLAGETEEFLRSFLLQYYDELDYIPKEVILPVALPDQAAIAAWLTDRKKQKVDLIHPKRGEKFQLLQMARENAELLLDRELARRKQAAAATRLALERLRELLALPQIPRRIEAFDISHWQGEEPVAAMVVFLDGRPAPEAYRRFRIRGIAKNDDYAALQEAVGRRFLHGQQEQEEAEENPSFLPFPDLLVIDGGKGQLNAVYTKLAALGWAEQPVISLAEKEEEIYQRGQEQPLRLPRDDQALHLLQHLRDEAHRFALTFHRARRQKQSFASALDRIKGIGPKRKKALLQKFGSLRQIREASLEELLSVEGMTVTAARAILEGLEEME